MVTIDYLIAHAYFLNVVYLDYHFPHVTLI